MNTRIVLLLATALLCCSASALAQSTWIVDQGGAGDFTTIRECIDAAMPGDTCRVNPGTYDVSYPLDKPAINKSLALVATEGPDTTIIDAGISLPGVVFVQGAPAVIIEGFTVTGGVAVAGGGLSVENSTVTVRNCIIRDNYSGFYADHPYTHKGGGGVFATNSTLTVEDSVISDNSAYSTMFHTQRGGGIYAEWTTLTVKNSVIEGNRASHGGGAVYLALSTAATFTNCTIVENEDDVGIGGIQAGESASANVVNSIFWNEAAELSGTVTATYSNVQGGFAGTGNINADPLFVGAGNYRLSASSPCIDAGTNGAPLLPALDLDGNHRVLDGNCDNVAIVDMGAYEFVANCPWPIASTVVVGNQGVKDSRTSLPINGLLPLLVPLAGLLLWKGLRRNR